MSQAQSGPGSDLRGGLRSSDGQSHGEDEGGSSRPFSESARSGLVEVKERAREAGSKVREKAESAKNSSSEYISDNPYRSVGIALGAGVIVGMYLFRRRSRSYSDNCD